MIFAVFRIVMIHIAVTHCFKLYDFNIICVILKMVIKQDCSGSL